MGKPSYHELPASTGRLRSAPPTLTQHPSHTAEKRRLSRIRGQLEGIDRMIDGGRYCIEIVTQIRAAKAALHGLENSILETHLRGCVRTAFTSKDPVSMETKIQEIMQIIT